MPKRLPDALFAGLLTGLLLGIADVIGLVGAREMFFDTRELLRTSAWSLGLTLGSGLIVGVIVWGADRVARLIAKKHRLSRKWLGPAAMLSALFIGPLGGLLYSLSSGPQARGLAGRSIFVVIGAIAASLVLASAILLVSRVMTRTSRRRWLLALVALLAMGVLHLADASVLVRLYPAFHAALTAFALGAGTLGFYFCLPRFKAKQIAVAAYISGGLAFGFSVCSLLFVLGAQNARFVIGHVTAQSSDILTLARHLAPSHPERILDDDLDESEAEIEAATSARILSRPGADLVLITIDAMRCDRLALLGAEQEVVPNLNALAEQSVVFARAYTPVPHTSYAITSLLTGKYTRPLFDVPGAPERHETWPEILHRFRYETSAFFTPAIFFIDKERFRPYLQTGAGFSFRKAESRLTAEERVDQMIEHLKAKEKSPHPHFSWAHFFEAHEPYDPECTRFGSEPVDRYDCEIWTVDKALGRLFDYLEKDRPDTIIIVTADHGEEFGDHGGKYHGTTLYDEQIRVPVVVRVPGVAHRVVDQPVSLVDLLGTSLHLLDIPVPARVRSRNLTGLMLGEDEKTDAFSEAHDEMMSVYDRHKIVCDIKTDVCRLYDLEKDPLERRSVAEQLPDRVRQMKRRLYRWRKRHAEVELRPVATDEGLQKWPRAIERALAGDHGVDGDLVSILSAAGASRIRQKAAELLYRRVSDDPDERDDWKSVSWKGETDDVVAGWMAALHAEAGDADALAFLAVISEKLEKGSPVHRTVALTRLELGDRAAVPDVLAAALHELSPTEERRQALTWLGKAQDRSVAKDLEALINTYQLTLETIDTLARLKARAAFKPIVARLKRERFATRKAAIIESLAILGDARAVKPIALELFNDTPPPGAASALTGFVKPTKRGRVVRTEDKAKRAAVVGIDGASPVTAPFDAVSRVIVSTPVRSEGAEVEIACGDETRTVPIAGETGEGHADFTSCVRAGGRPPTVHVKLTPEDLDVERFSVVLLSAE